MKKYIDMLTIGNLSPNLLSVLARLRLEYNIVSCRTESSAELIKPLSKLILREKEHTVYINDELVNLPYIEDYLENAALKLDLDALDYYYSIAVNKKNVENLPQIIHNLSCDDEGNYSGRYPFHTGRRESTSYRRKAEIIPGSDRAS